MAEFLNTTSMLQCPHGGTVNITSSNTRVKVSGDFVLRSSDTFTIAGCTFALPSGPHPCVQVQWVQTVQDSQVIGDFTLTKESVGLCVAGDMAVQGAVLINSTQAENVGL